MKKNTYSIIESPQVFSKKSNALIQKLDAYTRKHSRNVADYARILAQELSLPEHDIQLMYYAGLFHDIGKLAIPSEIIGKPGPLTQDECNIMREHPAKGAHILEQYHEFRSLAPLVLHHHEHYDGSGYPDGLTGEQIPFGSRLVAIVDAYDAITTDRSYRKAQAQQIALEELIKNKNKQFDPVLVDAFLRILEKVRS